MIFILTYIGIGLGFALGVLGVTTGATFTSVIGLVIFIGSIGLIINESIAKGQREIIDRLEELEDSEESEDHDFAEDLYSDNSSDEKEKVKDTNVIDF